MRNELKDRVAIVTGGAQGLGEAIAIRMGKEGCHVVVSDINTEKANTVSDRIKDECGRESIAVKVDVTSVRDVEDMVKKTVEELFIG